MKQIATGCLGIILGLLIGAGATYAVLSVASKQIMPVDPAPTLSAARADVSITASASFINSQVQPMVRQSGLLKQATITLDAPNIVRVNAAVDVTILGQRITANPTATMRVAVKSNRIALTVEKIDTGNATIPASLVGSTVETLRAMAEDEINRQLARALQGTNMRVVNVRVTPNDMTLDLSSQ